MASRRTSTRWLWKHRRSWPPLSSLPRLLSCALNLTSPCRRWTTPTCSPPFIWKSELPFLPASYFQELRKKSMQYFFPNYLTPLSPCSSLCLAPGLRLWKWSSVTHREPREFSRTTRTVCARPTLCPVTLKKWRLTAPSWRWITPGSTSSLALCSQHSVSVSQSPFFIMTFYTTKSLSPSPFCACHLFSLNQVRCNKCVPTYAILYEIKQ